jgi:hypothetical protein
MVIGYKYPTCRFRVCLSSKKYLLAEVIVLSASGQSSVTWKQTKKAAFLSEPRTNSVAILSISSQVAHPEDLPKSNPKREYRAFIIARKQFDKYNWLQPVSSKPGTNQPSWK